MIYTASFFEGKNLHSRSSFMATGDRNAVAKALDSDPIFNEDVDGWELHDETGRVVLPIESDYR